MDLDPLTVAGANMTDVSFHRSKLAGTGLAETAGTSGDVGQVSDLPVRGVSDSVVNADLSGRIACIRGALRQTGSRR